MQYDLDHMAALNAALKALLDAQAAGDPKALAEARARLRDLQR